MVMIRNTTGDADKNTLKIDIDELRTKAIFKIDFIDNLNSL